MSGIKKLVPKRRFKEFENAGAWEQRKLGELLKYEQPTKYIVKSTDYDERFETPVLTAGQSFILGYTDEIGGIKEASSDNPVIIFDDFTTGSHYVDFPFKVKSSAMKLLSLISEADDFYFVYNVLANLNYTPQSHERHWISKFSEFSVYVPNSDEQKSIGNFFQTIDQTITLHQRKLEKMKSIKSAYLSEMFPAEGKRKPKRRFSGFTDAWEQRKLGDEAEILAGGDIDKDRILENGKYPVLANALTNDGIVGYYDDSFRVESPAVTVTGRGDVGHAQARKTNFTPIVRLLAVKSQHDVDFLEAAINNHSVLVESTGVPQLTSPQLGNYKIMFPTPEEEKKIGEFFVRIDSTITFQQQKLEKLQNIKKAYINEMFI